MISLQQTLKPSPHIRERSRRMFVRTATPETFIVTPKDKEKVRRLVRFTVTSGRSIKIECMDRDSLEPCPANAFGSMCSHVNAAIRQLHANIKRAENRKRKDK